MTIAAQLLRRALAEDLALRKAAFVPLDKNAQQAAGPGGAPVDPAVAGGAPPAPGAAPMDMAAADPAAAAPVDPAMAADPTAAGAPPMDPAMMDPAMMAPPAEPPLPEPEVNDASTDVDDDGKPDTMVPLSGMKDFAVGLIEAMKGKKTREADPVEEAAAAGAEAALPPGPVTGIPGDLSSLPGPLKTASVLSQLKLKV